MTESDTCYVYRAYDRCGSLLYVGMSADVGKRIVQHVPEELIFVDRASGGTLNRPNFIRALRFAQHPGTVTGALSEKGAKACAS